MGNGGRERDNEQAPATSAPAASGATAPGKGSRTAARYGGASAGPASPASFKLPQVEAGGGGALGALNWAAMHLSGEDEASREGECPEGERGAGAKLSVHKAKDQMALTFKTMTGVVNTAATSLAEPTVAPPKLSPLVSETVSLALMTLRGTIPGAASGLIKQAVVALATPKDTAIRGAASRAFHDAIGDGAVEEVQRDEATPIAAFQEEMNAKIEASQSKFIDYFWDYIAPVLNEIDDRVVNAVAAAFASEAYRGSVRAAYKQATTVAWANFLAQLHNGSDPKHGGAVNARGANWLTNPKRQRFDDSHGILVVELDRNAAEFSDTTTRFHGLAVHGISEPMKVQLRKYSTVGDVGMNTLVRVYPHNHWDVGPQASVTILVGPDGAIKRVNRSYEMPYSVDVTPFVEAAKRVTMESLK